MKLRDLFRRRAHVAVLRLEGVIGGGGRFGAPALSDAGVAALAEAAFRGRPKAVALVINSPGGSAAQSSLIAARIRRLAEAKEVPVHAFVEDVAASGGYWLATAADEIHLDSSSIVGSIGVIAASFGLHDFISRYGIERRVHTAGADKSLLDPFRPERPEDVARLHGLLADIHRSFIAQVKARRGARLVDDPDLFSGQIWVGEGAVAAGLADGIGHLEPVMKARYGDDLRFRHLRQRRPMLRRLGFGMEAAVGAALATVEERQHWARFGLDAP